MSLAKLQISDSQQDATTKDDSNQHIASPSKSEPVNTASSRDTEEESQEDSDSFFLSSDQLTPIDIGDSFVSQIDPDGDNDILEALRNSFDQNQEEFQPLDPEEVDYTQEDLFFLTGELEDIEIGQVEQDNLDELLDYDTIFAGDSPSASDSSPTNLLASLEQDLVNLTLNQMPDLMPQDGDSGAFPLGEEELPDYMYCQPCNLSEEDIMFCQPCNLQNEEKPPQQQPLPTLDQQLMGSSLRSISGLHSIDEEGPLQDGRLPLPEPPKSGLDELPFELETVDAPHDVPSRLDQSFQSYVVSRRPEAVAAALSYTQSFGTGIYQPLVGEDKGRESPNEVSCLGHKETIYGIQFSPCGTFMASASQDATVRIWCVDKHRLLQTLTGHNKDSECLRVAWYVGFVRLNTPNRQNFNGFLHHGKFFSLLTHASCFSSRSGHRHHGVVIHLIVARITNILLHQVGLMESSRFGQHPTPKKSGHVSILWIMLRSKEDLKRKAITIPHKRTLFNLSIIGRELQMVSFNLTISS